MEVKIMGFEIGNGILKKYTEEKSVTEVTIPDGIISIGKKAFLCCMNLVNITMSDSMTSIGNYAFSNCIRLNSINIPESVTSIGDGPLVVARILNL